MQLFVMAPKKQTTHTRTDPDCRGELRGSNRINLNYMLFHICGCQTHWLGFSRGNPYFTPSDADH